VRSVSHQQPSTTGADANRVIWSLPRRSRLGRAGM
jgi:hypothetical protein